MNYVKKKRISVIFAVFYRHTMTTAAPSLQGNAPHGAYIPFAERNTVRIKIQHLIVVYLGLIYNS